MLESYGELHVVLDSGDEYHLHKHDVSEDNFIIHVDSKLGTWKFNVNSIESIEIPHSHKE